jgi:hypothetical protein
VHLCLWKIFDFSCFSTSKEFKCDYSYLSEWLHKSSDYILNRPLCSSFAVSNSRNPYFLSNHCSSMKWCTLRRQIQKPPPVFPQQLKPISAILLPHKNFSFISSLMLDGLIAASIVLPLCHVKTVTKQLLQIAYELSCYTLNLNSYQDWPFIVSSDDLESASHATFLTCARCCRMQFIENNIKSQLHPTS